MANRFCKGMCQAKRRKCAKILENFQLFSSHLLLIEFDEFNRGCAFDGMSQNSFSGESSESAVQRTVTISVIRDTGTKVQLMFKAHGLKKRKSLINSIVTVFKKTKYHTKPGFVVPYFVCNIQRNAPEKGDLDGILKKKCFGGSCQIRFGPSSPSRLLSNGRFTKFELKPNSLYFVLHVQRENKPIKSNHNANRTDIFVCEIKQFPTGINPDSAEFEANSGTGKWRMLHLTIIDQGRQS
ncbi:hypothetical protein DICVIV_07678 [Dictyocaulus viviparus]|uniref:Uncharacterized protein n=1 Tax=Dictyocaulus viviparus TaxID=29172 RepID=A0A0D8XR51_DICVI|nr:hypothetical protein DICVIV_07678 [Dictyocaulus viviparus]